MISFFSLSQRHFPPAATAAAAAAAKSLQSCLTLYDPIARRPPGSPIPGILQTRTLEWGAIAFFMLALYLVVKERMISL